MKKTLEVENLGKKYSKAVTSNSNFGSSLKSTFSQLIFHTAPKAAKEDFWALKNLGFDVYEGDVIGVIGRNGAGKSTLLKILSQITRPSTGKFTLNGRVASLLEVGTGFHPELTGRENIYMNGAILGMKRSEIHSKFQDIVGFAEVENFIDVPVKRYSSGMQMRLGFAVAAHLEPEILIVDEVLAVGDADFQKKALGKVKDVSKNGRTVLFVSHNIHSIQQICNRAIWLERGEMVEDSRDLHKISSNYLFGYDKKHISGQWPGKEVTKNFSTEYFDLISFSVLTDNDEVIKRAYPNNAKAHIAIKLELKKYTPALNFGYAITNEAGQVVYWSLTTDQAESKWVDLKNGTITLKSEIPPRLLNEGVYKIDFFSSLHARGYLSEPGNTPVSIFVHISGGLSESPYWRESRPGVIAPVLKWEAHYEN